MMIDIQRSAATGTQNDEEIDAIIKRAPSVTAEAIAVAIRVLLDAHTRYDVLFTRILDAVAAIPEPARSEVCDLLASIAPAVRWPVYKSAVDRLREWEIEAVLLHPSDRLVIANLVRADAAPIPLQLAAE